MKGVCFLSLGKECRDYLKFDKDGGSLSALCCDRGEFGRERRGGVASLGFEVVTGAEALNRSARTGSLDKEVDKAPYHHVPCSSHIAHLARPKKPPWLLEEAAAHISSTKTLIPNRHKNGQYRETA